MAAPSEGPNPLRPYYIPPSVGTASETLPNSSSSIPKQLTRGAPSGFSFGDLDYSDYLPGSSPSVSVSLKELVDKTIWKYASVLMAQPFEVAKLILQVHLARDEQADGPLPQRRRDDDFQDDESAGSSDDEPNFFTSGVPGRRLTSLSPPRGRPRRPPRERNGRSGHSPPVKPVSSSRQLVIKNPHSLTDALSSLAADSGALALWRATNTTFVYTVLHRTLEAFLGSFFAAMLGISEGEISPLSPAGTLPSTAILTSTAPIASVAITTAASMFSSIVLSPIDAARTRLVLTPATLAPRSLLAAIKTLPSPSYLIPSHLIPITLFTASIPALTSSSTPLLLKNHFNIDPVLHPTSWSIATFTISAVELMIRYPLETVLRRAQIATWTAPPGTPPVPSSSRKAIETIVPVPQSYRGIIATLWSISQEEGTSAPKKEKDSAAMGMTARKGRKGQGIEGLYRGWRVGMWGLVGVWGAAFIGGVQSGAEAAAEGIPVHGKKF